MATEWLNEFGHGPDVRITAGFSQQTSRQDNGTRGCPMGVNHELAQHHQPMARDIPLSFSGEENTQGMAFSEVNLSSSIMRLLARREKGEEVG